jgi:RimJ/RimL family protein N-acetyltransferase
MFTQPDACPGLTFRSATDADRERIMPLLVPDPASSVTPDTYLRRLNDTGEYRLEWTWIAEGADGQPLAVAIWWAIDRQQRLPGSLDALVVPESVGTAERVAIGAALLGVAQEHYAREGADTPAAFHFFLPADWRKRPDAVAARAWREQAASQAGLTETLERLHFEWTAQSGPIAPSGRLVFRPEPDDEVFVDLFRSVLAGTLDGTSRKEAEAVGAEAQAREDVTFYRDTMLGERSWWRVAQTPDGETVGFGFPSRNPRSYNVGYLGVLPEHRGHGYVDEILAEITRILTAEVGVSLIQADTDLANRPMAAAFERAGYQNIEYHLVLSAP